MRGDGPRSSRGGRGGRYRRGIASYHRPSYHGQNYSSDRRDPQGSGEDEAHGKDSSDYKSRAKADGSRAFSEDSRISKQLRRIAREDNAERYLDLIKQLQDSVTLCENIKYVRRNSDHILECLFDNLHSAPSRPCKWETAHCIGQVGHIMDNEVDRFLDMCFNRFDMWKNTELKVLVLRGLYNTILLDTDGQQISQIGDFIVSGLHSVLEGTEVVEVMVVTVDILRKIYILSPSVITPYFQDIVDILVGWHIDYSQPIDVTNYVSLSLQSFSSLWQSNVPFANTLLSQFVEDMEDYLENPAAETEDKAEDDFGFEASSNAKKVASFISVFTTILRCLSHQADPSINTGLSTTFHIESLKKMMEGADKLFSNLHEENILNALNQLCIVLLPFNIDGLLNEILKLLDLHKEVIDEMSFKTQLTFLSLTKQTIQHYGTSLSVEFVQNILSPGSSIRKLQMIPNQAVWTETLKVYHAIFAVKNIPLLQEAYKFSLQDMQEALKVLCPEAALVTSFIREEGKSSNMEKMDVKMAETLLSYQITVLADVANTRNSIITMWALTPSLVELLGAQLGVTTEHFAAHHPHVQQNILYLLYSHSTKHTHYISSSCMVVGASPSFVSSSVAGSFSGDSPPFSSSTSTSENLSTILSTITSVLKLKKVASSQVLCLCMKWANEILLGCESSLSQLLHKNKFKSLLSTIVDLGYHFLQSVSLCVVQSLTSILGVVPFNQLHCLEDVVQLCLYHTSHKNEEIRNLYTDLLCILPLSVITATLCGNKSSATNEYSSCKGDNYETIEIGNIDSKTIVSLQRHYLLHSSSQIPATSFHTIISYILNSSEKNLRDDSWMDDLFSVSQRVDRMSKTEDWSFAVLAPQLKVLLWKWLVWEAAQHCVANKLKTTLGKPYDTFTTIEGAIKRHAKEVRECGITSSSVDHSGEEDCNSKIKENFDFVRNQLTTVTLLVEFVECLEKAMFNASDGCAVAPHPTNKSVRIFFTTNRQTCFEWLTRIRAAMIIVSLNSGQPHVALRHSFKLLRELVENNNTQGGDFERAICYCVKALIAVGCEDAITGLYLWAKSKVSRTFPWIKTSAFCAGKRYEKALKSFALHLEDLEPIEVLNDTTEELHDARLLSCDPFVKEFINYQATECYGKLNQWENLQKLGTKINQKADDQNVSLKNGDLNFLRDLSHVEALAHFDDENMEGVSDSLENYISTINWTEAGSWPIWKRSQKVSSALAYAFTATVFPKPVENVDIDALIKECAKEEESILQLSPLCPHHPIQINALLNLQIKRQLLNIRNQKSEIGHLHEQWENLSFDCYPLETLHQISRWTKLFGTINQNISEASVTKLDLLSVKYARKFENYKFAEHSLIKLLRSKSSSLIQAVNDFPLDAEFTVLTSKLHREAAKMLACTGKVKDGCDILANIVTNLNPILATLASQDPSLLSLPPNEAGHICARSILTVNKWWNLKENKDFKLILKDSNNTMQWMQKIMKVYQKMKIFIPEELQNLSEVSHSSLPTLDANMGCFLSLAAIQCPNLPKVWYHVASWAFKWGRHILNKSEERTSLLYSEDLTEIREVLSHILPADNFETHLQEIALLLGSSRRREGSFSKENIEDDEEDDLRLEEVEGSQQLGAALSHMFLEWGVKSNSLNAVISGLLEIRCNALRRNHSVLTASANAYFKFLKIGQTQVVRQSDQQMIATLRLLRLIVKHASELKDVLEKGLSETPTAPWRAIIPQLFARLNHPEPYVRASISDLLCRLAQDCPHLIIFPAVVGSTGVMSAAKEANFTDMYAKYFHKKKKKKSVAEEDVEEEEESEEEEGEKTIEERVEDEDEEEEEEDVLISDKEQEKRTLMQNCFSTLVNTLKKQVGSSIAEVQTLIHELRRITVLWDELWLGTLSQHHSDLMKKCQQLKADIGRLNRNVSLSKEEKNQLIRKKYDIVFQPLVFVLDQLIEITSAIPETPHEKNFQETFQPLISEARQALISPDDIQEPSEALTKLRNVHQLLQQRAQKRSATSLKMAEISPTLGKLANTRIAMPGVNSPSNEVVSIASVGSSILILPTKTKPKKLSFQGSDGKRYTYLFKGLEDLHLDQRIMQFLATVNTMLSKNHRNGDSTYRAHYYSVVPLGARSGLIQWVGNATPLFGLYKRWQQREAQVQALKSHSTQIPGALPTIQSIPRPSDLYYSKLSPRLKEAGASLDNRKEWPIAILRDVFAELVKETPSDLLSRELWQTSINANEWWRLTHMYNISTAVMSIIGYVIGLGDRHLDNLLVNLTSGEVVHIDYNVCFEKGKNLRVPEKVPFRMTQNIEAALGVTGVEGIFRSSCEHVMCTMRKGRETLLTLLEAFIYDPLVDWTPDSEAGYAGAVYGGDQALVLEARQNRQQLERALTVTMFTVRLAEMKADWLENKNDVLDAIPLIMDNLEKWQSTHQALVEAETNLQEGHHLMAMIKEGEANPQHNIYGLLARYQEYTIVKNAIHGANKLLISKMNDLKNWQNQYKMANKMFQGGLINDLRSKLINIGPLVSSVTPVMEYMTSAGQSQLANQCEHNEMELNHALSQIVTISLNALEHLGKYGSVWVNYPSDHIEAHRISKHLSALSTLYANLSLDNVQLIIAKSHREISENSLLETQVSNIDINFHAKTLHLNSQLQKIYDHLQEEGVSNGNNIMANYQESLNAVNSFAIQQEDIGSSTITCALLNSLSQTLGIRLREDKAVASMGENLPDMMIGNLWWFSESLVSLGSVWELASLLNKYSPPSSPSETSVFKAMSVLQDVFNAIQDLVLNTSHIIVVEGGRLLSQGEPSVINIATRLQELVNNSYTPITTMLSRLTHHLHMTIFRMPSMFESVVQEANLLHSQLVNMIQQMTDTSFSTNETSASGSEMSQGQMLLMGFHLLFETVDNQLDRLIDALSAAPLPHPWPRVDMIRLSTEIMNPIFDPSLREVLRAMLRVKKVQTITNFFSQALQVFADPARKMSQNLSGSEEEQLTRIVRGYAGECVHRLLVGLPTYLTTHLILIHTQKLGVDVTGYIEARDVGTEGRVPLEGLVEDALEKCITQKNLHSVITSAAATVSAHYNTTRKKLLLKQWENEVEGVKVLLQRVTAQQLSHHWYYEEQLKQRVGSTQLQPNRSAVVNEIRKMESTFAALSQNVNELKDKFTDYTANVMHRLKWAAGSNPSIAEALEEFSHSVEAGSNTVNKVIRASEEVRSLCKAVWHYETLKITSVEALTEDNLFTTVLNKTQESCMVIQRYTGTISSQEELLIMLCPLPEEITPTWVKFSASAVSEHLSSLTQIVGKHNSTLKHSEELVHEAVEQLRQHLTGHHKLMSDVRVLLKSLAKFEQEGGMQGVDGYFCLYRRYSEIMSGVVRQLLHEPLAPDKISQFIQKLQQLLLQTFVIYDKLVEFGNQCLTEEIGDDDSNLSFEGNPKLKTTFSLRESSLFSSPRKVAVTDRSSRKISPLVTGKAVIQEHNAYALNVWRRVKTKLEGRVSSGGKIISVSEQVDSTIKDACNINNLATLYEGWTAWV